MNTSNISYNVSWGYSDEYNVESLLEGRSVAHSIDKRDSNWSNWKFNRSPVGPSLIVSAVAPDGAIAGVNAYGVINYEFRGKEVRVATPYETFVHPEFQSRGIFSGLLDNVMAVSREASIDILFFFPNSNSLRGLKKKKWNFIERPVSYYLRPLISLSNFSRFVDIKKPFFPSTQLGQYEQFSFQPPDNFDTNGLIHRPSPDYLKWRFNEFRENVYRHYKRGCVEVVARVGKRGHLREAQIVYFNLNSEHSARRAVADSKAIVNDMRSCFDLVGMPASPSSRYVAVLSQLGFFRFPSSTNFCFLPLNSEVAISHSDLEFTGIDFHTY